jgi:glyoxylase-like metal-dependent hydrolase (beta-lactamase superfamily II)/ferredoxin
MARLTERLPKNAPGEFYVDRSCIDCDTCRRVAPAVFSEGESFSYVHRQPASESDRQRALMALLACPTASIGTEPRRSARSAVDLFPERIDGEVYFCGFTAEESFGAWSYLVRRAPLRGNVLVDSPRAATPLLSRLGEWGGARLMFLTHRDDVADHEVFRRRFGCERILHRDDITSSTRSVERPIDGLDPVRIDDDLLAIPVPGHTRGHMVLLYGETYLFTGDHLAWSPGRHGLHAFRDACWYSWREQTRSMERLLDHRFEWVLPGHGWRYHAASAAAMRIEVERCVAWMRSVA